MLSKIWASLHPARSTVTCKALSLWSFQGRADASKWSEVSGDGKNESERKVLLCRSARRLPANCADCPFTEDCRQDCPLSLQIAAQIGAH